MAFGGSAEDRIFSSLSEISKPRPFLGVAYLFFTWIINLILAQDNKSIIVEIQ
jgi:hypothetical protein